MLFCHIAGCQLLPWRTGNHTRRLLHTLQGKKERIGRLMMMHANNREDVKAAFAGDIVAIGGLKDVITGETLCDEKAPIILERMEFPDPVIKIAIEPKSKADLEKMGMGLAKLAQEVRGMAGAGSGSNVMFAMACNFWQRHHVCLGL